MAEWTFRDYQRPSTQGAEEKPILVNEILAWTLGQPKAAQAKIDTMILTLQAWPPPWPPTFISAYNGYPGILELIIKSGGVQYRPLGCYGLGSRVFTLLIGAIEKGGKIPKGILDSADGRRDSLLQKGWPTCEHEFTAAAP
jgi:hypothetical protein